ncbi:pyridoxamine 5'-phosphate oxidase family protein [Hyphomonas sp.]|uniref:pyridoxamine 5'-phosphate oxidase family protein n=1 Tax=Hyphomonas sp. TaxID=87 RepID=UPI003918ED2E
MTRDPHPWAAGLASLHAQVWTCLVRGVHDRRAPARHPALATVTPDGMPRVRTVTLRRADRLAAQLDIHTDLKSAKVSELRARPFAALHVWDGPGHLQIRIEAEAEILSGADVADIWARVPEASRLTYGIVPPPGEPIVSALDYASAPGRESFALLRLRVRAIDVLHLGPDHRRACFRRADGWTGQWLAP